MNNQSNPLTNLPPDPNNPPSLPKPITDIDDQLDEYGNFKPTSTQQPTPPANPFQPNQSTQPTQPQPQANPEQINQNQPATMTTPPPTYSQGTPVTTESNYADQFLDQLNTMNVKPKRKGLKITKPLLILIGVTGLITLLVIGVALFARPQQISDTNLNIALLARVKAANNLSSNYYTKIRNSQLRAANANIQQALGGLTKDMTDYSTELANQAAAQAAKETGEKPKVITQINVKAEPTDKILEKLKEAALLGTLDATYKTEILYIVDQTIMLMNRLDSQTTNPKLKEILKRNFDNIKTTRDALEAVNLAYD